MSRQPSLMERAMPSGHPLREIGDEELLYPEVYEDDMSNDMRAHLQYRHSTAESENSAVSSHRDLISLDRWAMPGSSSSSSKGGSNTQNSFQTVGQSGSGLGHHIYTNDRTSGPLRVLIHPSASGNVSVYREDSMMGSESTTGSYQMHLRNNYNHVSIHPSSSGISVHQQELQSTAPMRSFNPGIESAISQEHSSYFGGKLRRSLSNPVSHAQHVDTVKRSASYGDIKSSPSIDAAVGLVQRILEQLRYNDSPPSNDDTEEPIVGTRSVEKDPQTNDISKAGSTVSSGEVSRISRQRHVVPAPISPDSQIHSAGIPAQNKGMSSDSFGYMQGNKRGQNFSFVAREVARREQANSSMEEWQEGANNESLSYGQNQSVEADSKMGHASMAALCEWTLESVKGNSKEDFGQLEEASAVTGVHSFGNSTPLSTKSLNSSYKYGGSKKTNSWKTKRMTPLSPLRESALSSESDLQCVQSTVPSNMSDLRISMPVESRFEILQEKDVDTHQQNLGYVASVLQVGSRNDDSHQTRMPRGKREAKSVEMREDRELEDRLTENETPDYCTPEINQNPMVSQREEGKLKPSQPKEPARLKMFGSEYARFLSTTALAPKMKGFKTLKRATLRHKHFGKRYKASAKASWNLEDADDDILAGAIIDIVITYGSDTPPPPGYYRISQTADGQVFKALRGGTPGQRSTSAFINLKKESDWNRAAQRPCVTALALIFPDRKEFVPPGFSVVKHYQRLSPRANEKQGAENLAPANLNQGTNGERVFLCFRRSREGNPLTGILPLQPALNEPVPEGYTVLEKTTRNFVASLNSKSGPPVFIAFRQRLANLETLRPLPMLLSVADGVDEGEYYSPEAAKLRAYYCTGGTVVPADVGHYHIMDRSTHSLLSPSSVANRLSLIELSRRRSLPKIKGGKYASSEGSSPRAIDDRHSNGTSSVQDSTNWGCDQSFGDVESLPSSDKSSGVIMSASPFTASYSLDLSNASSIQEEESSRSSIDRGGYYPSIYGADMLAGFDAMNFIPVIETAEHYQGNMVAQELLRARVALLTPILTACYTRHGGSSLTAVAGLASLLDTHFFVDDVDASGQDSTNTLTLLDLTVQVVCDVATTGAQEVTFGACVEFVEKAMTYCQGHFNTRTIGYVMRFFLFVFYFGASDSNSGILPSKNWGSPTNGQEGKPSAPMLFDPRDDDFPYLLGGAPQQAALAFKDSISLVLARLQHVCVNLPSDKGTHVNADAALEAKPLGHFLDGIISGLVDGAVQRVEVANFIQLAVHQIHRSGGSELFWHDMMTSCGTGLFGRENALGDEGKNLFMVAFAVLANIVKVCSGKVRVNPDTLELRHRDVSSKLLSLELLVHFLERWRDEATVLLKQQRSNDTVQRCIKTMAFAVRRLVAPCLLTNTKAALEDCRLHQVLLRTLSVLWQCPMYRGDMKAEMGMLMEHFGLRMLRLGPQLSHSLDAPSKSTDPLLLRPLLRQQRDLLSAIKGWFAGSPLVTLELYLNFDTDISSQITGPIQLLPGTQWRLFKRLCAAICNLTDQCGEKIIDQIRSNQSLVGSKQSNNLGNAQEMASVRQEARQLRKESLDAIAQIIKSLAQIAAGLSGNNVFAAIAANVSDDFSSADVRKLMSLFPEPSTKTRGYSRKKKAGGEAAILQFWREEMKAKRKAQAMMDGYNLNLRDPNLLSTVTSATAFEIARKKGIKKAVEYLIACNALTPSPRDIASFLRINKDKLDSAELGNFLGDTGIDGEEIEYWNLIRFSYFRAISFAGMGVEEGLRHFLTNCGFKLPGEAQKVDRIMSSFAQCYWEDNAGDRDRCPFQDQDAVFLLSFAIIMLNTDLHKNSSYGSRNKVRKKISKQEFMKNLSGVDLGGNITREYLSAIYDSIEASPIILHHEDDCGEDEGEVGLEAIRSRKIQSMVNNVRAADALLRGLSVHDFNWASVQDFSTSLDYDGRDAISDLVRSCFSEAWHQFHGIINTALETAHLDPEGLAPCLNVLRYALCVTICLDLPMERAAFVDQLGRFKVFEEQRHGHGDPNTDIIRSMRIDKSILAGTLNEKDKLNCLAQIHNIIDKLGSAFAENVSAKNKMSRVVALLEDGDYLLNDPARSFLRDGDLKKKSLKSGRVMDYRFFLFSDLLIYAKLSSRGKYKIHEELPLHLMKVVDWFPPTKSAAEMKRMFKIHHPRKSFTVYASNGADRNLWVTDIRHAIEQEIYHKVEVEAARIATNLRVNTNTSKN